MPISAAAASAGAALAGDAVNAVIQGKMNKRQYERAINFWKLQNVYNSPAEQMKRFKQAGLNPNLIYGNADNSASSLSLPDQEVPRVEPSRAMASYYNTKIQTAQVNNMEAQNAVLRQQAELLSAQTDNLRSQKNSRDFDLGFKTDTRDYDISYAQERLRGAMIANDYRLDENDRRALLSAQSLKEGVQRIINMQASKELTENRRALTVQQMNAVAQQYENLVHSGELQRMEIELRKQGVTSQDELWQRIAAKLLSKLGLGF